jgi:hypothetical protein
MKLHSIATCMIAASACASSALAAPLGFTQATHMHANIAQAAGTVSSGGVDYSFQAKSYVDFDGSRAGFVYVDSFSFASGFQFVTCTGPEFANVVSMNQSTGSVTVNGTLDLANPNCYAVNYSGAALTLQLSGQPDGSYRNSQGGTGTETINGTVAKYNFQSDEFGEVFTGSTGMYTGTFTGRGYTGRSINRTQVN